MNNDLSLNCSVARNPGLPLCTSCGNTITAQFARALDSIFHPNCFKCHDCNCVITGKFFSVDGPDGMQRVLCEQDYRVRFNLVCAKCEGTLRGSYVTAGDKKYHSEHFTCSVCPTLFGPHDSYYEHGGDVFCYWHYSTRFAAKCAGCSLAILRESIYSEGQMFHPKCYLVFKYLDIRLASSTPPEVVTASTELMHEAEEWKSTPESLIAAQAKTEVLAHTIWISLRAFEDSSALCVKDMLAAWRIDDRGSIIRAAERLVWRILELLAVIGEMGEGSGVQGDPRFERARGLCAKVINLFGFIPHVQYGSHLGSSMTRGLVIGLGADLRSLMQVAATGALELDAVERLIPRLGASIESDGSGVLEAMVEKCRSPEDNVVIGERGPVTELRDVSGTTEYGFLLNAALERLSWLLRNRSYPATTYPTSSLLFADLAEKPEQIMNVETKGLFRYDVESLTSYSPRFNLSSMVDAVYILGAAVCLAVTTLVVHHLILE